MKISDSAVNKPRCLFRRNAVFITQLFPIFSEAKKGTEGNRGRLQDVR